MCKKILSKIKSKLGAQDMVGLLIVGFILFIFIVLIPFLLLQESLEIQKGLLRILNL